MPDSSRVLAVFSQPTGAAVLETSLRWSYTSHVAQCGVTRQRLPAGDESRRWVRRC